MKWISVRDKLPEFFDKVLVYKSTLMGGYDTGIYIAQRFTELDKREWIVICDNETNKNNYRNIKEFSHWMPLPEPPKEDS